MRSGSSQRWMNLICFLPLLLYFRFRSTSLSTTPGSSSPTCTLGSTRLITIRTPSRPTCGRPCGKERPDPASTRPWSSHKTHAWLLLTYNSDSLQKHLHEIQFLELAPTLRTWWAYPPRPIAESHVRRHPLHNSELIKNRFDKEPDRELNLRVAVVARVKSPSARDSNLRSKNMSRLQVLCMLMTENRLVINEKLS